MSGAQMAAIFALLAATLISLGLTAGGLVEIEIGMTAVSVFATLGVWLTRK